MDPLDRPSERLTGASCAACGKAVPAERVRVLASRDELAFAELLCAPCGSVSLAIFVGGQDDHPEAARRATRPGEPVGPDDVLDMHEFLAAWSGDLHSLVGRPGGPRRP